MVELKPYTIYRRHIPEIVVHGRPLGRHVHHDSRSLAYQVVPDGTARTVRWDRVIPVLDQGNLGSCTGNAAVGHLGTHPDDGVLPAGTILDEQTAISVYSDAERVDGGGGYPPEDEGSSGLSVAKVCKARGLISGYTHATSLAAAQTAIRTGPFIVGTNWHTSMDSPDASGVVAVSGSVRGGHEYECIGYDTSTDLWEFVNSWGESYGKGGHFFYSSASFSRLLSEDGDVTQFVPLSAPAPVPTPTPAPFPTPTPTPAPDVDAALWASLKPWATGRRAGANRKAARAVASWATAKGYM